MKKLALLLIILRSLNAMDAQSLENILIAESFINLNAPECREYILAEGEITPAVLEAYRKKVARRPDLIHCHFLNCPFVYSSSQGLLSHIKRVHRERKHKCPDCSRCFVEKRERNRHIKKIHQSSNKFHLICLKQ